ncbi:hypothetical protein [Brevundimonas sp. NIBR11]|uniref:hypothetical protein n=1 Tax=Brevundimonas sp. NIBR11 TaxID=3015999 RepID=UPI0022F0D33D|nr:hypothetical protein [Brevundimonas sp. NIBR11]WGM32588.1 hypothetical protein KKHFBJBL_02842 [Brevundimonas sp. NIBR11]
MSLEAAVIERSAVIEPPAERREQTDRRGRERRKPGNRINKVAPRRSLLQTIALSATGISATLTGLVFATSLFVLDAVPWVNLLVAAAVSAFCLLAFLLGCIEQRLIEIRLELMMANGGARQADRRQGDRRG